jgi:dTDP-4-dehydrorhamnose reductase
MTKVLITGASGLVGARTTQLLNKEFDWLTPTSKKLDITNNKSVTNYFSANTFDLVLHLAAYTNVEMAEKNQELCHKINVLGTDYLFSASQQKNIPFILISTDFVFDGRDKLYDEDHPTNPLSYYGQTKEQAEKIVKNTGTVLRLSYPYGISPASKLDFVRTIINLLKKNVQIKAVQDSLFTPTFLDDIAFQIKYFIKNPKKGIYHISGSQALSPYQAFLEIAKIFNLNQDLITPVKFANYYKNKAPRPQFCHIISKYKFINTKSFTQGLYLVKELLD